MAFQSGHFFIHTASVCKNCHFCCDSLRVNIHAAHQIFQSVVQFFLIFHNHQRRAFFNFRHQCFDSFALQQDILFQVFPFYGSHGNEFFHCFIQRGCQCIPDDCFFLLCFFHRYHIGEFCHQFQFAFAACQAEFFFQQVQFFDISRCQCFVQFYFHIGCGKCFKADVNIGLAAEYITHDSFFDLIFQTGQRTGQFDSHIVITMVHRFHFHCEFTFFCDMFAASVTGHASYCCTHVRIPFFFSFKIDVLLYPFLSPMARKTTYCIHYF